MNDEEFGEGYFERGEGSEYKNYSWKPELIGPRIEAIISASKIYPPDKVLDFGCAKGYYVKYLRQKGFNAIGIDISKYALSCAPDDVKKYLFFGSEKNLSQFCNKEFNLTIVKDTLEHINEQDLEETIKELIRISKKLLIIVPFCDEKGHYIDKGNEKDFTHKIKYTKERWMNILGTTKKYLNLCKKIKGDKSKGFFCTIISESIIPKVKQAQA